MPFIPPDRSLRVKSMGLDLAVSEWGEQDAPPLLLIHGALDHSRSWDAVAGELRKDWRVIAPDLRGHGDSAWAAGGAYDYMFHIFDLGRVIEELELGRVPVVAHSMGGNIVLRRAGLFPDSFERIVAIEGLGPPPKRGKDGTILNFVERAHLWLEDHERFSQGAAYTMRTTEEVIERLRRMNPRLPDDIAQHLARFSVKANGGGLLAWKFDPAMRALAPADITTQELHNLWSRIECPTLLIGGTESWHRSPLEDGRAAPFRNPEVVTLERAGHWVHHDRFSTFVELVQDFLRRENQPRPAETAEAIR